jgi:quinoprotein glucose dehydrogenase
MKLRVKNKNLDIILSCAPEMVTFKCLFSFFMVVLFSGCISEKDRKRTWSVYKADASSTSYSPLDQINRDNVSQLQIIWTFNPGDARKGTRSGNSECNPIIIDGVMYVTSARHRLYAIDASTGKQRWSFDPF